MIQVQEGKVMLSFQKSSLTIEQSCSTSPLIWPLVESLDVGIRELNEGNELVEREKEMAQRYFDKNNIQPKNERKVFDCF